MLEGESGKILKLAARRGVFGQGWAHVKHGRSLQEFVEWLRMHRKFNRAYRGRLVSSWYSPIIGLGEPVRLIPAGRFQRS